jgi:hypothetical protein
MQEGTTLSLPMRCQHLCKRAQHFPYLHPLHYFVEAHALKSSEVDKMMDLLQEACFVMLLNRALAPKLVRDDF